MSFLRDYDRRRERVLRLAGQCFLERGFSKVTMDELAGELGMSKRTLYGLFSGKRELLQESLRLRLRETLGDLRGLVEEPGLAAAEKLGSVLLYLSERLPRPSRFFMADVQRSVPEVWEEVEEIRREGLKSCFLSLFRAARSEGSLREDVEPELLVLMILTLVDGLANPRVLVHSPLSLSQMVEKIWKTVCLGVLTGPGRDAVEGIVLPERLIHETR